MAQETVTIPNQDQVLYHGKLTLHNASDSHQYGWRAEFQIAEDDYKVFRSLTKRRKGKAGIVFLVFLLGDLPRAMECYFVGWSVSQSGARVRFDLLNQDDYLFLRELPAAINTVSDPASWDAVIAEVSDTGELVDQAKRERAETLRGGPMAQHAGKLCHDIEFRAFVANMIGAEKAVTAEQAADYVRSRCQITSRAELDHDDQALWRYENWVKKGFLAWLTRSKSTTRA